MATRKGTGGEPRWIWRRDRTLNQIYSQHNVDWRWRPWSPPKDRRGTVDWWTGGWIRNSWCATTLQLLGVDNNYPQVASFILISSTRAFKIPLNPTEPHSHAMPSRDQFHATRHVAKTSFPVPTSSSVLYFSDSEWTVIHNSLSSFTWSNDHSWSLKSVTREYLLMS